MAARVRSARSADTAEDFVARITSEWRRAVASIVGCGTLLLEAKDGLAHGEFGRMIEADLPFGRRTAEKLMEIARHPVLADATHESHLPASWTTLHKLSRIAPPELARMIESGEVNPDTGRDDPVFGGGEDRWFTPAKYVDAAREVLGGIDLDPFSEEEANRTVKADHFFTREQDGLEQDWAGRIYTNPPYTRGVLENFSSKLIDHYLAGDVEAAVVLLPAAGDCSWFQTMIMAADVTCFVRGRIRFVRPDGSTAVNNAIQGSAFFYLGRDADRFARVFGDLGSVVRPEPRRSGDRVAGEAAPAVLSLMH